MYAFVAAVTETPTSIRGKDDSTIVERPERLKALRIGLAAAISRLEEAYPAQNTQTAVTMEDELADALGKMSLGGAASIPTDQTHVANVIRSRAVLSGGLSKDRAVRMVHAPPEASGQPHIDKLAVWAKESESKIRAGRSEIPEELSQGDLYLCPGSIDAISGSVATVCEAVDAVHSASRRAASPASTVDRRAFVAVRPPGHHCGEDTPSGFCFVNNVAIGAAHAHLTHGLSRAIILDIDLHHGNGTQALAWNINDETVRKEEESKARLAATGGVAKGPAGLKIFYGSLHDILSYPCEDGDAALIRDASISINGPHGQYIHNIHLQPYISNEEFWKVLYPGYLALLEKARDFVRSTGPADDVLVFISCGFDASEHEYPSMSRHGRKVPTRFYHHFARDAAAFADHFASGRLVSVLEGGYSDRALISGGMAHFLGIAAPQIQPEKLDEWWSSSNLAKLEKLTKKGKGGKQSLSSKAHEAWLERTTILAHAFEPISPPAAKAIVAAQPNPAAPAAAMTLRDRKPKPRASAPGNLPSPPPISADTLPAPAKNPRSKASTVKSVGNSPSKATTSGNVRKPPPGQNDVGVLAKKSEKISVEEPVPTSSQTQSGGSSIHQGPKKIILRVKSPPPP